MTVRTKDVDIRQRACLVRISTKLMGVEKKDNPATDKLVTLMGCSDGAAKAVKSLINPNNQAYKDIKIVRGLLRNTHIDLTGCWQDDGFRIIGTKRFASYERIMDDLVARFWAKVDVFVEAWDDVLAEAKKDLGDMFNEADYPNKADVRACFSIEREVEVIPDRTNTILDLDQARVEKLQADAIDKDRKRMVTLTEETHQRVAEELEGMLKALREFGGEIEGTKRTRTFRNSLIDRMAGLADVLPGLNLTNDPKQDKLARKLAKLTVHDPKDLREEGVEGDKLRKDVADEAEEMLDALGGVFSYTD